MIIIRLLLTAVLLYFIYFETGPLTVVFLALIVLTFEAYGYSLDREEKEREKKDE